MPKKSEGRGKPGAPPRGPKVDKRATFTTRITERNRARIEQAATRNSRSISQEVEMLIERALESIDFEERLFGPSRQRDLFRMMAAAAALIESRTGVSWTNDWETSVAVEQAWQDLFKASRPRPKPEMVEQLHRDMDRERLKALEKEVRSLDPGLGPWTAQPSTGAPMMGGLFAFKPVTPEEQAAYDEKRAKYDAARAKYSEALAVAMEKGTAWSNKFEGLKALGSGVAKDVEPPSRRIARALIGE